MQRRDYAFAPNPALELVMVARFCVARRAPLGHEQDVRDLIECHVDSRGGRQTRRRV